MTRAAATAAVLLFAVAVALGAANLFWTSHEVGSLGDVVARQHAAGSRQQVLVRRLNAVVVKLRREVQAECSFNRDLAPLPLTAPRGAKVSLVGVELIAHARGAFYGAGCAGKLPPPSRSLRRWAAYYHRRVR